MSPVLLGLALQFALLSLLAFGGVGAVTPEIHRVAVDQLHWLSEREFVDYFAIAQGAPGPNVLFVTLIGWHVAGITGAIIATLAMSLPGAALTYGVSRLWIVYRDRPWRHRIQRGIAPVTVGLVCCTAWIMAGLADHSPTRAALTVASAALALRSRLNPLWLLAGGALLGAAGGL